MFKAKRSTNERTTLAQQRSFIAIALSFRVLAGAALIAAAVFIAYRPSINGGFILDDDRLIYDNDFIKESNGLHQIWCTTEPDDYWPVTNSTLWIEWRLCGMHPTGYHVTNLILHIAEALLIWIILRKLSIPGAFLAAMIFAVHPVNVESVAWIAQRKNTMAMLFFLLSILWYIKAEMSTTINHLPPAHSLGGPWERVIAHCPPSTAHCFTWHWLSLAAFVLAMLSKGSVVILPVLMLGIIWWLRPLTKQDMLRTAPFFLVAAVLAVANVWFQTHGSGEVLRVATFIERLLGAGGVVWFYLYKALLPLDLAFVYPQWHIEAIKPLWWLPLLSALAVTALLWWYRESWSRPLLFAWGFFCVALVPVMGFTDVGFMKYSLVADHYQYIAIIGAIALASAAWSARFKLPSGTTRCAATVIAFATTGTFMFLTWRQNEIYSDAITLYQAALDKNPGFWMGHGNLARTFLKAGRWKDALPHYERALVLKPNYFEAHNDLGVLLAQIGRPDEAIEHSKQAVLLKPKLASPRFNLGIAYQAAGQLQQAIDFYNQALRIKPNYPEALSSLGLALAREGRTAEAFDLYQQALSLKSDFAEVYKVHNNLGLLLAQEGKIDQAIDQYTEALRLKPNFADAHENLGVALVQKGRIAEGIEHYYEVLRINPDFIAAHNNLALALDRIGRTEEAISHLQFILQKEPDFTEAYFNLGLFYAEIHRSSDALDMCQKALELAQSKNQAALAKKIEDWLNKYRASLSKQPIPLSPSNTTPQRP